MSPRKHKRRRLDNEQESALDGPSSPQNEPGVEDVVAKYKEVLEAPTGEFNIDAFTKEQEIWDAFREEQYEVLEQLPLTLHRTFSLIQESDHQVQENISHLTPAILKYVALRGALAGTAKQQDATPEGQDDGVGATPGVEIAAASEGTLANGNNANANGQSTSPSPTATLAPASNQSRTPPAGPKSLATVVQSSDSTRELLISIAQSTEEIARASNEKFYLARHAYDLVDRYIRDLDRAIKEQETSISLGLRPGTHPASIILPELIIPKSSRTRIATPSPPEPLVFEPVVELPTNEGAPPFTEIEEPRGPSPLKDEVMGEDADAETVVEPAEPAPPASRVRRKGRKRRKHNASRRPQPVALDEGVVEQPIDIEGDEVTAPGAKPPLMLRIPPQAAPAVLEGKAPSTANAEEERYCFCNQGDYGIMIACDGVNCAIEWFHIGCVGVSKVSSGKWYCRDCESKRRKGKKRSR